MAYTNAENQARYKARMYEAGYKQAVVWVKRENGARNVRMDEERFIKRLRKLTAGWDRESLSRLLSLLVRIAEGRKEETGKA
jgi:hypothetical protein